MRARSINPIGGDVFHKPPLFVGTSRGFDA